MEQEKVPRIGVVVALPATASGAGPIVFAARVAVVRESGAGLARASSA